ncbi:MAG: hypothetical protein KGQ60_14995 [Planctomycetes bacterium]|nr:hypothetical protein [Planctomycetota bacterium]
MATSVRTVSENPVFEQTFFAWDESETQFPTEGTSDSYCLDAIHSHRRERSSVSSGDSSLTNRGNSRRGRCEHVSGTLATVLGNYGIGIDALITEIERLRRES